MIKALKKILSYYRLSFVFDLKANLAYPTTFWMTSLSVPLWVLVQALFIETIYGQTENFLGYTKYENYVLFGTYKLVQSIAYFFFYVRLWDLKDKIRGSSDWSLDMMLLKPIDSQLFATTGKFWLGSLSSLFVGVAIIAYGLLQEPHRIHVINLITYLWIVLMGVFLLYFIFLFIQTSIFWLEYMDVGESLWVTFQDFGMYPKHVYQGGLGLFLNILIPITLMGSIPVDFLFGRMPLWAIFSYSLVILILFLLTRMYWLYSIKKYASFSS